MNNEAAGRVRYLPNLDQVLNGITLLVAVVLLALTVKHYVAPTGGREAALRPDSPVHLPEINWLTNGRTLVFALQPGCQYCKASAEFYRDLLHSNDRKAFHPLVVVPGHLDGEEQEFLRRYGIPITDVQQANFADLNISGTPTLLLVRSDGKLAASWAGKLSRKQESEVFQKLGLRRIPSGQANAAQLPAALPVATLTFALLARSSPDTAVVDIRERADFVQSHIANSLNIPLDEIEARASHELPKDADIVVYCRFCSKCAANEQVQDVASNCEVGLRFLRQAGFSRLSVLEEELGASEAVGIKLVRAPTVAHDATVRSVRVK